MKRNFRVLYFLYFYSFYIFRRFYFLQEKQSRKAKTQVLVTWVNIIKS